MKRDIKMKSPAVFMDRDGTINEQMGYINHLSRFIILPGVREAIRLFLFNNLIASQTPERITNRLR